jgi:hypothetical protein
MTPRTERPDGLRGWVDDLINDNAWKIVWILVASLAIHGWTFVQKMANPAPQVSMAPDELHTLVKNSTETAAGVKKLNLKFGALIDAEPNDVHVRYAKNLEHDTHVIDMADKDGSNP